MRAFMRVETTKGAILLGYLKAETDQAFVLFPQNMIRETANLKTRMYRQIIPKHQLVSRCIGRCLGNSQSEIRNPKFR